MRRNRKRRPKRRSGHYTQWAAQHYVAAELSRRGYLVALTLGNAEATDLMAISSRGSRFSVEVKGLRDPNPWLFRRTRRHRADFVILVHITKAPEPPVFYVLSRRQAQHIFRPDPTWPSLSWSDTERYEGCWSTLPR
jgi:hypothetical protein